MQPIKILHCADLHLGFKFKGLGRGKTSARTLDLKRTFSEIMSLCLSEEIQLLLVAGDLFESWESGAEEFSFVANAFEQIPLTTIAIVAGNHDPLTPDALYKTQL